MINDKKGLLFYLNDGRKNEDEGDEYEIVQSCRIGHFRQVFASFQTHEGHSEDRGDT